MIYTGARRADNSLENLPAFRQQRRRCSSCPRPTFLDVFVLTAMFTIVVLVAVYLSSCPLVCNCSPRLIYNRPTTRCGFKNVGALCLGDFTTATLSSEHGDPEETCLGNGLQLYVPNNVSRLTRKWISAAFNSTSLYVKIDNGTYAAFNLTTGKIDCEKKGNETICNVYGETLVLCMQNFCEDGQRYLDTLCAKELGYPATPNNSYVGCKEQGMRLPRKHEV